MLIIDATPQGIGWYPINYMVRLAARLLEADLEIGRTEHRPTLAKRLGSILSQRRPGHGTDTCLIVCASPVDLLWILEVPGWRTRFRFVAAWVIDSFWLDWIPATLRRALPFDHIFITSGEDADGWHRAVGIRPTWLPWGTDALRLGSAAGDRRWDLTRVGRQPAEWENDLDTAAAAAHHGIRFQPRPPEFNAEPIRNHLSLMEIFATTKYTLAFSNLAHPARHTHPTRAYITGRWVDSLGCGAVVAGCAPHGASIDGLLWPGATLELGTTRRDDGLQVIAQALSHWTADVARRNHTLALQRLDWRLRFEQIAEVFGEMPTLLADELRMLKLAHGENLAGSRE